MAGVAIGVAGGAGTRASVDRERLKWDRGYLLAVAGHQLQQASLAKHRGLATFAAFQKALGEVGLRYGQPEVDDILQYCTTTEDGYVHYADLLRAAAPFAPSRAQQSNAKAAIFPAEEDAPPRRPLSAFSAENVPPRPQTCNDLQSFLADRAEEIRKVYARWERGALSNEAFAAELRGMGVTVTTELQRYLVVYGPSRDMSFGKLMYALQAGADDGRRARAPHGGCKEWSASIPTGGWGAGPRSQSPSSPSAPPSDAAVEEAPLLRQAITDFLDGTIRAVAFRQLLKRCGVPATPSLERVIRTHELDGSARFQDLACVLLRQERPDHNRHGDGRGEGPLASAVTTPSMAGGPRRQAWAEGTLDGCAGGPARTSGDEAGLALPLGAGAADPEGPGGPRADATIAPEAPSTAGLDARRPAEPTWNARGAAAAESPPSASPHGVGTPLDTRHWEVRPPFATSQAAPLKQDARSNSESRARGHSGDIIGWKDRPAKATAPPRRFGQDLGSASPARLAAPPQGVEDQQCFGRRHYVAPPAHERTPYGRDVDMGIPAPRRPTSRKPFGTDQDLRLRRPEDAGTDEYRATIRAARRVVH